LKQQLILAEGNSVPFNVDSSTYTTVLVKRGILKTGDFIVAGATYAKVRRMTTADGKSVKQALPGTPVEVTGWKDRPDAGDLVLQAPKESDAKLAVRNRIQLREQDRDQKDLDSLNERRLANRKGLWQERERRLVAAEIKRSGQALPGILREQEQTGPKELRVIIKADVSGSAEAVEEAIKDLGNAEVKVGIVDVSVGEVTESDVQTAIAANGTLSFNGIDL
jgi:translation initiation factor IF-2